LAWKFWPPLYFVNGVDAIGLFMDAKLDVVENPGEMNGDRASLTFMRGRAWM
jgi:hypothetical protein